MSTVDVKLTLDIKKIIKWLTIIMVVSLFILPFFGTKTIGEDMDTVITGDSLFWTIIQGHLFTIRDAGWLWVLFMSLTPIAVYFTRGVDNIKTWAMKSAASFLSFIGALLLIVAWGKDHETASTLGTWVYMFASLFICILTIIEGKDYFIKK